jgi:hypothetical protein
MAAAKPSSNCSRYVLLLSPCARASRTAPTCRATSTSLRRCSLLRSCIRQHASAYGSIRQHMPAYVCIGRQHTSAYVCSMRQHTHASLRRCLLWSSSSSPHVSDFAYARLLLFTRTHSPTSSLCAVYMRIYVNRQ